MWCWQPPAAPQSEIWWGGGGTSRGETDAEAMAQDRARVSVRWRDCSPPLARQGQPPVGTPDKNLQEKHNSNSKIYIVVMLLVLPVLDVQPARASPDCLHWITYMASAKTTC